jgi:hypothetical protein
MCKNYIHKSNVGVTTNITSPESDKKNIAETVRNHTTPEKDITGGSKPLFTGGF